MEDKFDGRGSPLNTGTAAVGEKRGDLDLLAHCLHSEVDRLDILNKALGALIERIYGPQPQAAAAVAANPLATGAIHDAHRALDRLRAIIDNVAEASARLNDLAR